MTLKSEMKVARMYGIDDLRVETAEVPSIGPGEALVRTRACGICTGDIMDWYMAAKSPLVFGHEPTGEIVETGEGVKGFGAGDRVFVHHHAPCGACRRCRQGAFTHCKTWRANGLRPGGMAEYFAVAAPNLAADTLILPDGMGFEEGSLIEPTACVVKSLRRALLKRGDVVVVIGLGIMGQLHVALAKQAGAEVIAADLVRFRLETATRLGADHTIDVSSKDLMQEVGSLTSGELADVVIVGPGSIEAMTAGIGCAGADGRVIFFTAAKPEDDLTFAPNPLYFNEVSLIPSYSCGPDDTREALRLLVEGALPVDALVTHRFRIDEVDRAIATAGRVDEALKTLVVFD